MIKIIAIYGNGGESLDQYTVVLSPKDIVPSKDGLYGCLGMSEDPTHYMGFSQFSECALGSHLGKKINIKDLPANIQQHIEERLQ